jgi:hypothetical protein
MSDSPDLFFPVPIMNFTAWYNPSQGTLLLCSFLNPIQSFIPELGLHIQALRFFWDQNLATNSCGPCPEAGPGLVMILSLYDCTTQMLFVLFALCITTSSAILIFKPVQHGSLAARGTLLISLSLFFLLFFEVHTDSFKKENSKFILFAMQPVQGMIVSDFFLTKNCNLEAAIGL